MIAIISRNRLGYQLNGWAGRIVLLAWAVTDARKAMTLEKCGVTMMNRALLHIEMLNG